MIYTHRDYRRKRPLVWVGLGKFPFKTRFRVPGCWPRTSLDEQQVCLSRHPVRACWEGIHQGPLPRHKWLHTSVPSSGLRELIPPPKSQTPYSLGNQKPEAERSGSGILQEKSKSPIPADLPSAPKVSLIAWVKAPAKDLSIFKSSTSSLRLLPPHQLL